MIRYQEIAHINAAIRNASESETFTVNAVQPSEQKAVINQIVKILKKSPNSTIIVLKH